MDSENTPNNLFLSMRAPTKPCALLCYFYDVKDCKDRILKSVLLQDICILQFP